MDGGNSSVSAAGASPAKKEKAKGKKHKSRKAKDGNGNGNDDVDMDSSMVTTQVSSSVVPHLLDQSSLARPLGTAVESQDCVVPCTPRQF